MSIRGGYPHRGDVYFIENEGYAVGHEIQKSRPGVIVSNNFHNRNSKRFQVVYMTSTDRSNLKEASKTYTNYRKGYILCDTVTTVDESRLIDYIETLPDQELANLDKTLLFTLGLDNGTNARKKWQALANTQQDQIEHLKKQVKRLSEGKFDDRYSYERARIYEEEFNKIMDMLV